MFDGEVLKAIFGLNNGKRILNYRDQYDTQQSIQHASLQIMFIEEPSCINIIVTSNSLHALRRLHPVYVNREFISVV